MKRLSLLLIPLCAGCLSPSEPRVPSSWLLTPAAAERAANAKPPFGEVRLSIVQVRAPYDGKSFVVLRPDGSVAFDPYNQFASTPSALVKGSALDVLRGTGLFVGVQPSVTTADVKTSLELVVDELALDCRSGDSQLARVSLTLVMIRNRQVVSAARSDAAVEAVTGNYTAAFGTAFSQALAEAAGKLKK